MKKCARCSETKSHDSFYLLKSGKLHSYCKPCTWLYQKHRLAKSDEASGVKRRQWSKWVEANPVRYSHVQKLANARRLAVLKTLLYEVLGEICVRCGFADKRALQIDHIHGNGAQDKEKFGSLNGTYLKHVITTGTSDYQLLCANCNWIKRHEEGKSPAPYAVITNPYDDPFYKKYKSELIGLAKTEDAA